MYAMTRAMRAWRKWTLDNDRHAIEVLPPADYLRMSYYERWLTRLARQVVEHGFVTSEEMESGKAAPDSTKATPALTMATSSRWLTRGIASSHDPTFGLCSRRVNECEPVTFSRPATLVCHDTPAARSASWSETTACTCFPTPTHTPTARNGNMSIRCVLPRASCGGRPRRRATRSTWTCGMTISSERSMAATSSVDLRRVAAPSS